MAATRDRGINKFRLRRGTPTLYYYSAGRFSIIKINRYSFGRGLLIRPNLPEHARVKSIYNGESPIIFPIRRARVLKRNYTRILS